jgi:sulfopropanediol 3-dehydrogenase
MSQGTTTPSSVASRMLKSPARSEAGRGSTPQVRAIVEGVIADIRERGDAAVREYSAKFDDYAPESFRLTEQQLAEVMARVPQQVIEDITFVQEQVRAFATRQLESVSDFEVETLPGVRLGQRNVPIRAAGAYVPGGKYPLLASAHMTIVTAKVAGVQRVAACTPLIRGEVPDATIAAMHLAGADEIYLLGGIQAVAAMAVGTETIEPVNMLAGPGNAFVAEAKRQLFGEVGIDLFAGPTEVLIVADEHADPFVVAVDLLSQAEHGPDSPAVLVTTSQELGRKVIEHVEELLVDLPTRDFAAPAWARPTPWPTSTPTSTCRSSPPTRGRPWRRCTTTGRCSWARGPACPTGTRSSAPTTCCPPAGPPATPGDCGSGSTCGP